MDFETFLSRYLLAFGIENLHVTLERPKLEHKWVSTDDAV